MATCIWCGKDTAGEPIAVEHVIPEAMGCPPDLVLRKGEVCRSCNNGLAPLDRAVAQEFDLHAFWSGVPRKRGRPPAVDSRGNVVATVNDRSAQMRISSKMRPTKGRPGHSTGGKVDGRNVGVEIQSQGDSATINIKFQIGSDPRYVRGIVKIAFSALAFYNPSGALERRFDEVREFVRIGQGRRRILLAPTGDVEYRHQVIPPLVAANGLVWSHMRLGCIEYFVDLSPGMGLIDALTAELERLRPAGYVALPIREDPPA